jgi:hypothetical protein
MSPDELGAIEARANAATPGPWQWRGNVDTHHLYLGNSREVVMAFARWGMQSAQPMFRLKDWLEYARAFARYEVAPDATERTDPRVYRGDLRGLRHPDAEFIACAREDVAALVREVRRLRGERMGDDQ